MEGFRPLLPLKLRKRMKVGACVYLMHCYELDVYKIGYTTQMPEKRKRQIERPEGNPYNKTLSLEVQALIFCEDEEIARFLESKIHQEGEEFLTAGKEWFITVSPSQEWFFGPESTSRIYGWKEVALFINDMSMWSRKLLSKSMTAARERHTELKLNTIALLESVENDDWDYYDAFKSNIIGLVAPYRNLKN